ncbi:hypothetical protein ON010_g6440 [Phytophthora cinnamomi]|nr:hypothetical protein ON010_g6440 [Phytophthora cinnamomi]
MARLTSRSYLHLAPEAVEGDFDHLSYAKVVRINEEGVRSLEGREGTLSCGVTAQHVVAVKEVSQSGQLFLLRRQLSEQVHVGQVVAVNEDQVTVMSGPWSRWVVSPSDTQEVENLIMDRVLGRNGPMSVVSEGLMADEYYPVVEGGKDLVPDSVGVSFCRPPTRHPRAEQADHYSECDQMEALFDPFTDDYEAIPEAQRARADPDTGENNGHFAPG